MLTSLTLFGLEIDASVRIENQRIWIIWWHGFWWRVFWLRDENKDCDSDILWGYDYLDCEFMNHFVIFFSVSLSFDCIGGSAQLTSFDRLHLSQPEVSLWIFLVSIHHKMACQLSFAMCFKQGMKTWFEGLFKSGYSSIAYKDEIKDSVTVHNQDVLFIL